MLQLFCGLSSGCVWHQMRQTNWHCSPLALYAQCLGIYIPPLCRDTGLSNWCPSHWIWVVLSSFPWMKPLSSPSLAEQAGFGAVGGVRLGHPCWRQLSQVPDECFDRRPMVQKKGRCHWKAEVPCSVPCFRWYVPKGREVLPCSSKGSLSGWESVLQSFRSSVRVGLSSRVLPVLARGAVRCLAACRGAQLGPLSREQRWCWVWIPLWRAGSVTEVRKDPLLLRVCVYVSINMMYFDQGMQKCSASH